MDGTLQAKETAAHQALDLALQRGGDQAVLKLRDNAIEYYGGKTKTVQKRTKIRSRIIATEVKNLMEKASNVIIMGHRFADHDSIGSCVGMARFAMHYCPKVNIAVNARDANLKGIFQKLKDVSEYKTMFISGSEAQDLITSSTLLVITDVNNVRQFEAPELFENIANVVIIDHHRQSGEFMVKPTITYIEPSASSASELVCEMLEQQFDPGSLLKEEAELLFAGIILDTKQFANNTGPRTFAAAHYLRSEGANPAEAQMLFRSGLDDFKKEIKYEANAFTYRDIIAFSYIEENATQEDKIAAAKAADRLLTLEGVLASFVLCRIDNTVHISARSSGTVNVQLITEKLHGGGHFDMAGAQMKDSTIKDTFVLLKQAIDEYLNEA
jgi:c-di-AMP phosphodiesterase-like protein